MTQKLHAHLALTAALATFAAGAASAATISLGFGGDTSQFTFSQQTASGATFDRYDLPLTGLNSSDAVTVSQGDTVNATVILSSLYTMPMSASSTYVLQYFTGGSFPSENTGVSGTFNFYDLGVLVKTLGYSSTTSGQLASFGVEFPPNNGAVQFDSYTNDFTINTLATPATLDGSSFEYLLVTSAPEPATWGLMLVGFGLVGGMARRRGRLTTI